MAESNMYLRNGGWVLRAMVGGRLYRESLHVDDVREARRLRDKRLKDIQAEVHHGERRVSWKDAVVQWLEHTEGQVSPSTLNRYVVSLAQVGPFLESLDVDRVDAKVIAALVAARRKAGVKPATVKRDLTAISSVLRFAEASGQREGNPALDSCVNVSCVNVETRSGCRLKTLSRQFAPLRRWSSRRSSSPRA